MANNEKYFNVTSISEATNNSQNFRQCSAGGVGRNVKYIKFVDASIDQSYNRSHFNCSIPNSIAIESTSAYNGTWVIDFTSVDNSEEFTWSFTSGICGGSANFSIEFEYK